MKASMLMRLKDEFGNNAEQASSTLGIAASTLKGWRKKEAEIIKEATTKRLYKKTMKVHPRKALIPDMETELFEFFTEQERWGLVRDDLWIVEKARNIVSNMIYEPGVPNVAKLSAFRGNV